MVYGATVDSERGPIAHVTMGVAGTCTISRGMDGSTYIGVESMDHTELVKETYSAGGASIAETFACPYIPRVRIVVASVNDMADCGAPRADRISELPLNSPDLFAVMVRVPVGVHDPYVTPDGARFGTTAMFAARVARSPSGRLSVDAKELSCSVSPSHSDVCAASLALFLAETAEGSGVSSADLASVSAAIRIATRS